MKKKLNNWKSFIIKIVLPSIITISLFIISLYAYLIPTFEKNMLDNKREMISELTNSAWSILNNYHQKEKNGVLTRELAQQEALLEIMNIRYGKESKDYFWINDMHPKMIMHPYKTNLNGEDLNNFVDLNGKRIFVDFVKIVEEQGDGYLDYMWQWKDDSTKVVPKLSYVKGFAPWKWVIGTGVYIEDVKKEIETIESNIIIISGVIIIVMLLMLTIIIINSINTEKKKTKAENELIESREKYKTLIEQTNEGTVMILDHKIVYSNTSASNILGYNSSEFSKIEISTLFNKNNASNLFSQFLSNSKKNITLETNLITKNKDLVYVVLNISKISFGDKNGISIIIRDISKDKKIEKELDTKKIQFKSLTKNIDIGIFRTTFNNKSKFIEVNPATLTILGFESEKELFKNNIFELFQDNADKKSFFKELIAKNKVKNKIVRIKKKNGEIIITSISITVVKDNINNKFCDGVIQDITTKEQSEQQKDQVFNELQASQFFMNCSINMFADKELNCSTDTSIINTTKIMSKNNRNAILISSENKNIGIVTDSDIRKRVVSKDFDLTKNVSEIMTAPIISIKESAFVFEAILLMHENNIKHLCIKNNDNKITHILDSENLRKLQIQSSSFIIKEINAASYVDEIVAARQNLHWIVKSMIKSGANTKIITGVMASVFDLIIDKLINFAIKELGEPPAKFAFIGLGSEGRGEETLITDQDNAIIYEDVSDDKKEEVRIYFDNLGNKMCDWLNEIGYTYCMGKIMANNPKWNQPISVWQNYFTKWISTANSQDLLEINIFFDYRCLYGSTEITENLRNHINEVIKVHPQFFIFMVQNTLLYKPPLNIFGNIVLESKTNNAETLNIKDALIPIVSFARIYSIQKNISKTNTLERFECLYNKQILTLTSYNEIKYVYNYLMQLRLKNQINLIDDGVKASNDIIPKQLTNIDRSLLKKVLSQIQNFQTKLNYDFKGGR